MRRPAKKEKKRFLVLIMLLLVTSQKVTAQSTTPLQKEKVVSKNDVAELTIEEVMEIAEEEIERTSQEAVKAALLEVGGELAYEKERADQLESVKASLELENEKLKEDCKKKSDNFFYGCLIGGTGGVFITSVIFSLIQGLIK